MFTNFKKTINPHELEAQQTPSRISMKKICQGIPQ